MIITGLAKEFNLYQVDPLSCLMIHQNFAGYVGLFHKSEPEYDMHIQLKQEHTKRVCDEIRLLGESLGMSGEELAFCESIAWLHDIGRFEQYDKYRTFADTESENHARLAVSVIKRLDLLKDFSENQKKIVLRAILNHNIPRIPAGISPEVGFYSRLLRDADKLDIWRVTLEYNIFHQIKTETFPEVYEVPDKLTECFEESRIIMLDEVDSYYDSILFRLSWIYDLSFPHSFLMVKERGIIARLIKKLPHSSALDLISDRANEFVLSQIR